MNNEFSNCYPRYVINLQSEFTINFQVNTIANQSPVNTRNKIKMHANNFSFIYLCFCNKTIINSVKLIIAKLVVIY